MASPSSSPPGGGALLALSIVAGALIGLFAGQPSIGILAGAAIGVVLAIVTWRRSR